MRNLRIGGLLAALVLLAAACAPKQRQAESLDPAFANYVKAYTGGVVSDGTAIRVELATPVPMDKQTDGLFRPTACSPSSPPSKAPNAG